jgi:hypothetical protein
LKRNDGGLADVVAFISLELRGVELPNAMTGSLGTTKYSVIASLSPHHQHPSLRISFFRTHTTMMPNNVTMKAFQCLPHHPPTPLPAAPS